MDPKSKRTYGKYHPRRLFKWLGSSKSRSVSAQTSSAGTENSARPVEQRHATTTPVEDAAAPALDGEQKPAADKDPQHEQGVTDEDDSLIGLSEDIFQASDCEIEPTEDESTSNGGLEVENVVSANPQAIDANKALWDRAIDSMTKKAPKMVKILQESVSDIPVKSVSDTPGGQLEDEIEQRIHTALAKRHDKIRGKDGAVDSSARKWTRRISKFIGSTKTIAMPIAAHDPHKIAPAVLGGFYFLVGMIEGATEDGLAAIKVTAETAGIVARWHCIEEQQIRAYQAKSLQALYRKLSSDIVVMYETIIRLLATLLAWFDSKWRQALSMAMPQSAEWKNLNELIKSQETNCNVTKDKIAMKKEQDGENVTILNWICPAETYDIRVASQIVKGRTGIDKRYRSRCQWILEADNFDTFQKSSVDSVLWLRGIIGTGKTTAMAQAIRYVEQSPVLQAQGHAFAQFYFKKARTSFNETRTTKEPAQTVETCLRSILRQLCWDNVSSSINAAVKSKYCDIKDSMHAGSTLALGECVDLIHTLLASKETYIMIDGIDECSDPTNLLEQLKQIWTGLRELKTDRSALHLMVCSRIDSPVVSEYFPKCSFITTSFNLSAEDQEFYISTELEYRREGRTHSKFFDVAYDYPTRLGNVLRRRGQGLFRWIEIQIQFFTGSKFSLHDSINEALTRLETETSDPELQTEYERLVELLRKNKTEFELALKLLRFITCCSWPLSADSLAEMINMSNSSAKPLAVTGEEVRALLAGFVSEEPHSTEYELRFGYRYTKDVLELAHASVLEYLTAPAMIKEGFAEAYQHSQVLNTCFACMKNAQQSAPYLQKTTIRTYRGYRGLVPDLLYYCCREWPRHCSLALTNTKENRSLERTSDFVGGQLYALWNRILGDLATRRELQTDLWRAKAKPIDQVWHDSSNHTPGFVIVANNLTVLLDDPKVRDMVDFSDINGRGQSLFNVAIRFSTRATFDRLLQSCPKTAPWNGHNDALHAVISRKWPDAMERLLLEVNREQITNLQRTSLTQALRNVLRKISSRVVEKDPKRLSDVEPLSRIGEQLLTHGANIWSSDDRRRGMLHWATVTEAQIIIFDHAPDLKHGGARGSVQRLLRMKDAYGRVPLDVCEEESRPYLEEQLLQAINRDGGVLEYNQALNRSETLWFDAEDNPDNIFSDGNDTGRNR